MKHLFILGQYLKYLLTAQSGKGHGVHSPFVYDFITKVLRAADEDDNLTKVHHFRNSLLHRTESVEVLDLGAGSHLDSSQTRKVSDIARMAGRTPKFGRVLFHIVRYYQPSVVVELGTSLGIGTSYMAAAYPEARIHTLEGSPAVASLASSHFQSLALSNIQQHVGNFDQLLLPLLHQLGTIDLLFIDGNHSYEPTKRYFEQALAHIHPHSILIFDDIHWSKGMQQAWQEICDHPSVTLSIDLFFVGLVFFRPDFHQKQHFTIRY